ncbi:hypothetical protein [Paenibacillus humicus]|uniref:hypothetical protein n=1 Tax=Paenibacillus humicus TaxID=412861 RepID=UPI003F15053C
MSEPIDVSQDITRIIEMVRGRTEEKKLAFIQHHLRTNYDLNWRLNDVDTLESQLRSAGLEPDVYAELYDLLDQSFSIGNPYFIYEFRLKNNMQQSQLAELIEVCLPIREAVSPFQGIFTSVTRISDIENVAADYLSFTVKYELYNSNPVVGGGRTQGELVDRTTFDVYFDFQTSLCYIKSGDRKQSSTVDRYLKRNIVNLELISYSLHTKAKNTEIQGDLQYHLHSAIIFHITDYLGITFINNNSDKVRSVRLGGTNLFESFEVAERLQFGDKIKSIKFQLSLRINTGNQTTAVLGTVRIDFTGVLKIVLTNMTNNVYQRDYVQHIIARLNAALTKTHQASDIEARIRDLLRIAEAKDSFLVQRILRDLMANITNEITDNQTRCEVIVLINQYIAER